MHSIDFHGSNGYILYKEMNLFFAESVEQTPVLNNTCLVPQFSESGVDLSDETPPGIDLELDTPLVHPVDPNQAVPIESPLVQFEDLLQPASEEDIGLAVEVPPAQLFATTPFVQPADSCNQAPLSEVGPVKELNPESVSAPLESSEPVDSALLAESVESGSHLSESTEEQKEEAIAPVEGIVIPETESKMADPESPPPLPKAGYNIDWDNFDENINPFATKSKVSSMANDAMDDNKTSDLEINPFQCKNKMADSPPSSPKSSMDDFDPFQSKNQMSASPTPLPEMNLKESADINQNVEAAPANERLDEPREGEPADIGIPTSPTRQKSPPK